MMEACAYLVPHNRLLYSREILQGGEKDMTPRGAAHVFNEAAELLAKSNKHFILILNGLYSPNVSGYDLYKKAR
jgi:hypothetical protein